MPLPGKGAPRQTALAKHPQPLPSPLRRNVAPTISAAPLSHGTNSVLTVVPIPPFYRCGALVSTGASKTTLTVNPRTVGDERLQLLHIHSEPCRHRLGRFLLSGHQPPLHMERGSFASFAAAQFGDRQFRKLIQTALPNVLVPVHAPRCGAESQGETRRSNTNPLRTAPPSRRP